LERCFMHQAALYFLLFKWIVVFSHVAQNKVGSRHGTQLAAANPQFVHLTLGPKLHFSFFLWDTLKLHIFSD
jgi:hypothetical protein